MPPIVVSVAIFKDDKVLLTKRDDFHVWCLPSGGVEWGETVADAAMRETKEETGLEIELTRLIGLYSRIGAISDIHAVHFSAIPTGGKLQTQAGETLEVRYFPVDDLPDEMIFGHQRRITDSVKESANVQLLVHRYRNSDGGPIPREELYRLRDESGLSPSEFYMSYFADRWIGDEQVHLFG